MAKGVEGRDEKLLAPPCGLFCGCCVEFVERGTCHGCGCACGKCDGEGHAKVCRIRICAADKCIESCTECAEFPCTELIQFACHPIWRTHLPVIENLRRRKKIGAACWIEEQKKHFSDEKRLRNEIALHKECEEKSRLFSP